MSKALDLIINKTDLYRIKSQHRCKLVAQVLTKQILML